MLRKILIVLCLLTCLGGLCLAADTNNSTDLNHASALKAYDQGLAYDSLGQIANATGAYRHAVGLDPKFAEAWYSLGLTLYAVSGKFNTYDEAIGCFGKAVALNSSLDVWDIGNRDDPPMTVNSKEDWENYKLLHAL